MPAVMADAVAEALDGADRLYLSRRHRRARPRLRARAPARPSPAGCTRRTCSGPSAQLARRTDVVALDVVEVSPPYDHADLTVNNAHRVVYEFLSGLAARRRDAGLPPRG